MSASHNGIVAELVGGPHDGETYALRPNQETLVIQRGSPDGPARNVHGQPGDGKCGAVTVTGTYRLDGRVLRWEGGET